MLTLRDYQEEAVDKLIVHTIDALGEPYRRQIPILLKAPTGAGKTIAVATYLGRLVDAVRLTPGNHKKQLAFIWLAPNTLHLQSYEALTGFYDEIRQLTTLKLDELVQTQLNTNEILFLNWGSVDKKNNAFIRSNEQGHNLANLITNTQADDIEIIVIIDEAHLSAFTGTQAIQVLRTMNAKVQLSVTATPTHNPDRSVVIARKAVIAAQMIKKGIKLNPEVSATELNGDNVNFYLLRKAVNKVDELLAAYKAENSTVNPLLLIQLPSENIALTDEDRRLREQLLAWLEFNFDMTIDNFKVAVWLSGETHNLEQISKPTGAQRVLIFKQAIAQGWDCPRASVLLMYREIKATQFGIQTVGRILRMPDQRHYDKDDLNHGYVYTNLQANVITFVPDDEDYFETLIGYRRADIRPSDIAGEILVNDRPTPGFIQRLKFEPILFGVVEAKYGLVMPADITVLTSHKEIEECQATAASNRAIMTTQFWQLDVTEIIIVIPKDIYVDQFEEMAVQLAQKNKAELPIDKVSLDQMFDRFCYGAITKLNKAKSWRNLKFVLNHFFEFYFHISEYDAVKIMLSANNQPYLIDLIDDVLAAYDEWQKVQGNNQRRVEPIDWQLPEYRFYKANYKEDSMPTHGLKPYYFAPDQSRPEREFAKLLESWTVHIDWWYKNGDKGQEHYAISYKTAAGADALFYLDFIVQFKNGTLGLYDTKTLNSDPEDVNKHNALIAWCALKSAEGNQTYIGSLAMMETRNETILFKVCTRHVNSIPDLTGWFVITPPISNKRSNGQKNN